MAKSGKSASSPKSGKPQAAAVPVRKSSDQPPTDWLERPATNPEQTPLLRKLFWGLAAASLILLVALSMGSGINADDKFQDDYSKKLVSYYSTFGQDSAALNVPDGNMHLYGGFFEIVTGFANKALGLEVTDLGYHNLRHGASAILGWVAILCAALLARLIAGWQAGIMALLILLLSPRFVGDSLMNPKDIPFAAGYMMALYNMAAVLNRMPTPGRWNLVGLVVGLGIALAVRAGGLLPFAYLGMFAGLHFLLKNGGFQAFSNAKLLGRYAVVTLGVAAAGYLFAILFWPYALQSPLKNPFIALSKFAELEVRIRVLFDGINLMSDKTPWNYPVKWMLYTIPLATLLGLVGAIAWLPRLARQYNPLWVSMVLFAGIFPVVYIIYKHSVIHDGWRHLTFAYPPLVVAAALFWNELARYFSAKKVAQYAVFGAMGALLLDSTAFIATNPKYPYTYFNPLVGGIKGAYGKFETDYWGVSVRQGLEWMEQQGILKPDMPETIVIATNMYHSAKQLTAKYGDKVKVKYMKWEKRCDDAWDYALYPTRFLDGATLQRGQWPPANAVHVVEASGVPLLAVLKDNGRNCTLGMASAKLGDWPTAISYLQKEVQNVPDNDLAWATLAQAYLNSDQLEEAKKAAEKALEISPDDVQANNLVGMYWLQKGDANRAKTQFETALDREPSNAAAYYYLALIARSQGDNQTALNNLRKAIETAPNFKAAYELSAQIYEATGNPSAAQQFRAALSQIK
ncbi:MAG: tetratricopeptide repeat protein [Saprospiraceae bacterium]|nr:tetratricopeptide repeat protein [Saprospiraceae bacterium]